MTIRIFQLIIEVPLSLKTVLQLMNLLLNSFKSLTDDDHYYPTGTINEFVNIW